MKTIIKPTILRGTRDFLPQQIIRRNAAMNTIKQAFEQFGYSPIETPILSPAETILGKYGDEGDQLSYSFTDRGGRKVALPYDLTVPFARYFAANYRDLPVPFKRYQIQRVWRAERPQKGRLREFYQCDIDIIGSKEILCEAEIAKIITVVFGRLNIQDFTIKINSRRLLNEILTSFNVSQDNTMPAIRIIDKILKIGDDAVISELQDIGIANAADLIKVLKPESTNDLTIKKLNKYDTSEINSFIDMCRQLSVPDNDILIDPTLARGLDYYTGLTFEVVNSGSNFGTICAGGRYDNLCGMFSEQSFSGMGVAFGFERIMLLLEERDKLNKITSSSQYLVSVFDEKTVSNSLSIYNELIKCNIPAEIYLGYDKLSKQLKFADKKQIPFVIIQGPDEFEKGVFIVRDMATGKQSILSKDELFLIK